MSRNKVFFHGVGTGIGDMVREMTANNIPVTVKAISNGGFAREVVDIAIQSGVKHNVIYRDPNPNGAPNDHPDWSLTPKEAAIKDWGRAMSVMPSELRDFKDHWWYERNNEMDTSTKGEWIGKYCYETGLLALRDGVKILMAGFNAGQPDIEEWELYFSDYLRLCSEHPDRIGVSIHEAKLGADISMTTPPWDERLYPWLICRWEFLNEAADNLGLNRPTIFVSEYAWSYNDLPSSDIVMRDIAWVSEKVSHHDNIKGVCMWNLDHNPNWGVLPDKLAAMIPKVAQFTLDTVYTDNPPPSDGFHFPVGTEEERLSGVIPPGHWEDVNPFGTQYVNSSTGNLSYHTGSDLNLNWPVYDSDRGVPIYSIGNGICTFSGSLPIWGNVIVIQHSLHGAYVYSRYGHVYDVMISAGDVISRGEVIGKVGRDALNGPYHLHFDISLTDILYNNPGHWPGLNEQSLYDNYVDPMAYIWETFPVEDMIEIPKKIKHTIHLLPQDTSLEELRWVTNELYPTRTAFTFSHDVAHAVGYAGNSDSVVVVWNPERWDMDVIDYFENQMINTRVAKFPDIGQSIPPVQPPTQKPDAVDMSNFFVPAGNREYGDILILKNNWGAGDERTQLQVRGINRDTSYIVKNSSAERRRIRAGYIDLEIDTSPGNNEYYTFDGHWMPRYWAPGWEDFSSKGTTKFFSKSDCSPIPGKEYANISTLRFGKLHDTWKAPSGLEFSGVAEVYWLVGGNIEETYWYAPHAGLVMWANRAGLVSYVTEYIPLGNQHNNVIESLPCADL